MRYSLDEPEPRIRWWIPITGAVAIILVAGSYSVWRLSRQPVSIKKKIDEPTKLPRMANLPPTKEAPKSVSPPYSPDAQLLEQVRESMRKGINPEDAVDLAKSLPQKPERADAAFILLEYAAEVGHVEAAFIVAQYYDPTSTDDSGTIIKDPVAAYEWYMVALSGKQPEAQNHLLNLRKWIEKEAKRGSREARELLSTWQ